MSDFATPLCPEWYQPLLRAVSEAAPCGENLEDDSTFLLLESRLQPRMGAEYGDFVEAVEAVNWAEIERDVTTLLTRSLDLRLVMILIRCRFRSIGIPALDEGLSALIWMLQQWPTDVYPQLYEDGLFEPVMRANVLAELNAPEGILGDLRQQQLPKVANIQLSIRDFERARLTPHAEQAIDEPALTLAQQGWLEQQPAALAVLCHAEQRLQQLHALLNATLTDETPDFSELFTLLALFRFAESSAPMVVAAPPQPEMVEVPMPPRSEVDSVVTAAPMTAAPAQTTVVTPQGIQDRSAALVRLREVKHWFVRHEPSSPVNDLLALAEQMVGKRFNELMQILPQDLLTKLSNGQENRE